MQDGRQMAAILIKSKADRSVSTVSSDHSGNKAQSDDTEGRHPDGQHRRVLGKQADQAARDALKADHAHQHKDQ